MNILENVKAKFARKLDASTMSNTTMYQLTAEFQDEYFYSSRFFDEVKQAIIKDLTDKTVEELLPFVKSKFLEGEGFEKFINEVRLLLAKNVIDSNSKK